MNKEELKEIIDYIDDRVIPNEKWEKIKDYMINLQKENKILNKGIEYAKRIEKDYKTRFDKAIRLLKEAGCYDEETKTFCDDIFNELPDILNALEGSDKNV